MLPTTLRGALWLGIVQGAGLVVFTIAVAVSAISSTGWRADVPAETVALAEVVTFGLFGLGMALTLRALHRGRRGSRAPYLLIQLFAIVVGDRFRTGDGAWPYVGWILIASGVVGVALMFLPDSRAALDPRPEQSET
jgi:hypothetical protein